MHRRVNLSLSAALLLTLALTACGGSTPAGPEPDAYVTVAAPNSGNPVKTVKLPLEKVGERYLYQGDILFTPDSAALTSGSLRAQANVQTPGYCGVLYLFDCHDLWPNATLYYFFDPNVPASLRQTVADAAAVYQNRAKLTMLENGGAKNRVRVHVLDPNDPAGGNSHVGMDGGEQHMYLKANASLGVVLHEFGHAWGLWHEQSRADRDQHIQLQPQNIISGKLSQYQLIDDPDVGQPYGPYDYFSVMHYPSRNSFSVMGPGNTLLPTFTLVNPPSGVTLDDVGQQTDLSSGDVLALAHLYGRPVTDARIRLQLQGSADLIAGEVRDLGVWIGNSGPVKLNDFYMGIAAFDSQYATQPSAKALMLDNSGLNCQPSANKQLGFGNPLACYVASGPGSGVQKTYAPIALGVTTDYGNRPLLVKQSFMPVGTLLSDPSKGQSAVPLNVISLNPDFYEANDTPSAAKSISLSTTMQPVNLHRPDDVDCFKFSALDAASSKAYSLEGQAFDTSTPLTLKLYAAGNLATPLQTRDNNLNVITTPGNYVVCVSGQHRTRYELRLDTVNLNAVTTEILKKLNTPIVRDLNPGTPIQGTLLDPAVYFLPPLSGGMYRAVGSNLKAAVTDSGGHVLYQATPVADGSLNLETGAFDAAHPLFIRLTRAQDDVTQDTLILHLPATPYRLEGR